MLREFNALKLQFVRQFLPKFHGWMSGIFKFYVYKVVIWDRRLSTHANSNVLLRINQSLWNFCAIPFWEIILFGGLKEHYFLGLDDRDSMLELILFTFDPYRVYQPSFFQELPFKLKKIVDITNALKSTVNTSIIDPT